MLVLERIGHVAVHDALRQALDDRRLADAGLPDQHGVVLGAAGQHLHHPADLLVSPDHRIELRFACLLGEIEREPLERLVLLLRLLIGHAVRAPHRLKGSQQVVAAEAACREQLARRGALLLDEGEQHVLGRDVGVAQRLRFLVGAVQHPRELARKRGL